ncbi:MAG: hypothetical protein ACYTBJ_00865 [Planctomycetota bacterium]|jgi:DNA repair exonuclease SbcCD ATPase subunit
MSVIEQIEEAISRQQYVERRVVELEEEIKAETSKLKTIKNARHIVKVVVALTQNRFKTDVEALMTSAIRSVFGRFKFTLDWNTTATKSDLNFEIHDGNDVLNLEDDLGCSILDIISIASRPVFHKYQKEQTRKVIFLDEPAKWVGRGEYLDRTCALLRQISAEKGYQFIIITHEKKFVHIADKAFNVIYDGERSAVTEITDMTVIDGDE